MVERFRMPSASSGLRHPASASCLGRHSRLAGRCPNNSSLFPPLAAVVVVALWAYSAEFLFYFAFGATAFAERSVAMEAPLGLLSGRAVCVSRWRGFTPTSSAERSKRIFTSGVVKLNCICHTAFSLVNLFYQYFRFYNSSVLYYNKVATLLLKSTGGCFLDS